MPQPMEHTATQSYAETVTDFGEAAVERGTEAAALARDTVKEHPIATLAVIAGLAFAVGALWKIGHARQRSPVNSLRGRLSELQAQLPRGWRT